MQRMQLKKLHFFLGLFEFNAFIYSMKVYQFEELDTLVRFHLRFYKKQKSKEDFYANNMEVCEAQTHRPLEKVYVFCIEQSLSELSEDERLILTKENLESTNKNWWMEYFSKSTYYRLKYKAMDRFIHCLHSESVV